MTEFHLFMPQIRMTLDVIVDKARDAERAGFDGIALMDHLVAPGAEHQPTWDAMATATWIAAHTSTLTVGHLVLCDAFRHPAVLAKQAVTIDHASGGRFELGRELYNWANKRRERRAKNSLLEASNCRSFKEVSTSLAFFSGRENFCSKSLLLMRGATIGVIVCSSAMDFASCTFF